jgi:TonB-linked SusC/RagA family outer membrane protein
MFFMMLCWGGMNMLYAQTVQVSGTVTGTEGSALSGVSVSLKGTVTETATDAEGKYSINAPSNGTLVFSLAGLATQEVAVDDKAEINVTMTAGVVTGVVLNAENGNPVPGVFLSIPGEASAITDDAGRFAMSRASQGAIIQVKGEGFAYKEIIVGGKSQGEMTIQLYDASFPTVYKQSNTPFGSKDWVKNTAAVSVIDNDDNHRKGAISVESLIQDNGLGMNTLMRSGMPGAGGNLYMRGFNSLHASNQPLIVIDGVPYENFVNESRINGNNVTPLSGFDTKDVKRITILKDAASLYGSKGANGVILIETTKATEQATVIDVYGYAGLNQMLPNPYKLMNATEYRSYLTEMLTSSGKYTTGEIQALPFINRQPPEIDDKWDEVVSGNADYYRYNHDTDWQKEIFRSSLSQNYGISIKGGDDIAMYALSVGFLDHEGAVKNTGFSRYNTQFNAELYILKWLKMHSNMSVAYSSRDLANEGFSIFNPIRVALNKTPIMHPFLYDKYGVETPNIELADVFGESNPIALIGGNTTLQNKTYRFFGNVGATVELSEYFIFDATFGVTFDKMRENIFMPEIGLAHGMLPSSVITNEMQASVYRYMQYYVDAHVGYLREFDKVHTVSGNVGFRYQTNDTEGDWINAYNSSSDDMHTVSNGKLELANTSGVLGDWKWMSFYLNGEYGYKNKYFLSYNMAVDGSSRFGKDADGLKLGGSVFGVFPSVTGAWILSSEDFMSGMDKIDLLKLRLGYSLTGNDDIGNYSARPLYVSQNFLGFQGLVRANIANQALKWETSAKMNLGVDAALLNERLSLTLDVYQSTTRDMLNWKQGEDFLGIPQYAINDGTMKNTGFEIGIQGRVINKAFKWDLGLNLSRYKNEVTAMADAFTLTQIAGGNVLTQVGNPIGLFYGYQTDGVYATSGEATAAALNIRRGDGTLLPLKAGDVRFVNQNTDNVIDESDMVVIGDPNPDLFGSVVSKMQWKHLTLNAVFTYSLGNDIYNAVRAGSESMTGYENQTININNRWSKEGHITVTPKATWGDPMGNSRFSDRWIEDGSYLRLKSLSLSYDIPLKVRFIRGLQVYATGLNLFTLTKYLGYDPEFSAMQNPLYHGIDVGMMPQPRTIMFGIKMGL